MVHVLKSNENLINNKRLHTILIMVNDSTEVHKKKKSKFKIKNSIRHKNLDHKTYNSTIFQKVIIT